MDFHIATTEEIKSGRITDVYFERTLEILRAKGVRKRVRAEFIAKEFPRGYEWAVLAGIEECAALLNGMPVTVRAMEEGTVFRAYQPVLEIEGEYTAFCVYETALLGLLCQASGVATRAARCKHAAGERKVISFGARRMHPALAPLIERNAYVGGCDGVAVVKSAELLEEEASGTMPHALIIVLGSTREALRAFHEVIDPKVKRVALVDTFGDEKFETLGAAEELGEALFAVRLDTPGSRRGNFLKILEEVRWELDLRGHGHVRLFVSGGIDEYKILPLNPVVDAYGVGTAISNAPVIDFSMDIVEVEGKPLAKRGKQSGSKRVLRCDRCRSDRVIPRGEEPASGGCPCGGTYRDLLLPFVERGKIVRDLPKAKAIRAYVLEQLAHLPPIQPLVT